MHYCDFDTQITARTKVVREHWPVDSFCSPHSMPIPELRVLYNVLSSDDAPPLFRKLTDAEYKDLRKDSSSSAAGPEANGPTEVGIGEPAPGPTTSSQGEDTERSPEGNEPAPTDGAENTRQR